jgi:segregation and condensation protein B
MEHERMKELAGKAEALLFVSDEPVSAVKLSELLGCGLGETDEVLTTLSSQFSEEERGIQLREVAGGWRLYTHPAHHDLIERFVLSWDTHKLSQAALETLSVVAYNQPATRMMIASIRGVNSDGVISSLVEKGLIKEVGRDNSPGSPLLYGTTKAFLEKFGLKSLKGLPPLEDYAPNEESKALIRERLSAKAVLEDLGVEEEAAPAPTGGPDEAPALLG